MKDDLICEPSLWQSPEGVVPQRLHGLYLEDYMHTQSQLEESNTPIHPSALVESEGVTTFYRANCFEIPYVRSRLVHQSVARTFEAVHVPTLITRTAWTNDARVRTCHIR